MPPDESTILTTKPDAAPAEGSAASEAKSPAPKPAEGTEAAKQDAGEKASPEKPSSQQEKAGGEVADDKAKAPAAVDIEIKLPQGVQADEALLAGFKPLAKELGLDSAKAQKVADLYLARTQQLAKEAGEAHQKQVQDWRKAVEADKEIGGDHLKESLSAATVALGKFATPELGQLLESTGLGNHPALVRFVVAVGKAMGEDTIKGSRGGGAAQELSPKEFLSTVMYPNSK